jgi:hypothetical protein
VLDGRLGAAAVFETVSNIVICRAYGDGLPKCAQVDACKPLGSTRKGAKGAASQALRRLRKP